MKTFTFSQITISPFSCMEEIGGKPSYAVDPKTPYKEKRKLENKERWEHGRPEFGVIYDGVGGRKLS